MVSDNFREERCLKEGCEWFETGEVVSRISRRIEKVKTSRRRQEKESYREKITLEEMLD